MNYSPKIDPEGPSAATVRGVFRTLGQQIGEVNVANGWDTGRQMIEFPDDYDPKWITTHLIAEIGLIMTEASEGIEEIRDGHAPSKVYYTGGYGGHDPLPDDASVDVLGDPRKPNGLPSELADIIIRTLDIADTHKIDIGAAVIEKLNHNATRGLRHGGKEL